MVADAIEKECGELEQPIFLHDVDALIFVAGETPDCAID